MRLARMANGSVNLKLFSHYLLHRLEDENRGADEMAFDAAHLRGLFTGELRDAQRLASVALDTMVAKERCEDCHEGRDVGTTVLEEEKAESEGGNATKKEI